MKAAATSLRTRALEEALRIIDDEGLDALSIRRLADVLGVKGASLYHHFKDKDDRILYFKKQGALFYDPDGSGSAKAIQFANVTKNLKVTHKDFFIF